MDRVQGVRLFVRVVELGSFSKAAAELCVGQPAATKLIARLEQQLGARLLHRSTRGVTPTEIGALYYEKCRLIAKHLEEAESVASLLQSQVEGTLRISTSVAFGRRVLGPLMLRFLDQHPALQVDLSVDDRYVNLIEQGVDVAVRMGRLSDSTLGSRFLGMNPWVLVAAPTYLSARGELNEPDDLRSCEALIYSTAQGDARWHFTSSKGETASVPIRGPLRSNSLHILLEAAVGAMGMAVLPRYVAHAALMDGSLHEVLPEWRLPGQEIHAVYPSPRMVPLKVSRFTAWLSEHFQGAWWSGALSAETAEA